jgi:hypothetical protein
MSLRFDTASVAEDEIMANKPAHKKRAVKKPESAKVELKEATAAKEAPAHLMAAECCHRIRTL